ncbi:MAG: HRDC domain-containing protein [Anaerolineae bacterium]|nr:HRDC domain-containing protein [Anaerolineae bacterium]
MQHETDWDQCLQRLRVEPRLALDLEANSLYAYHEEVCLIQLSIPGQDYIIDPKAGLDLSGLGELFARRDVEKVFHAAEYDLMLVKRQYGWELNNLFDTMWAARILGIERVGLANMLEETFDVRLNKRFQRANWCKRPLSVAELAYAQADTHFLLELRDRLAAQLEDAGYMEEAREIFEEQTAVEPPSLAFDPESFWTMNGTRHLPAQGKAILRALAIYRDKEAAQRNKPHFKILQDKTLLQVAKEAPRRRDQLARLHGMSTGQLRRYGHDILRIVRENLGAPAPRRPRRKPRPPQAVLDRYEALRTWRKEKGLERGVESDVILSRDALWALAYENPQTEEALAGILGPWRRKTYGKAILALLAGLD